MSRTPRPQDNDREDVDEHRNDDDGSDDDDDSTYEENLEDGGNDGGSGTITEIRLENNGLNGTIPREILGLKGLEILALGGNALVGTLPRGTIADPTNLRRLTLNDNGLSGNINALSGLPNLVELEVQNNRLTGTIPPELGGAYAALRVGRFHGNGFTGTVPGDLCDNIAPLGILAVLTTDCGGRSPSIQCDCCTTCFDGLYM